MLAAASLAELAGAAAAVAAELARLHSTGATHGAVDAPGAVRVGRGRVELAPGPGTGTPADDVAALGRIVAAALADLDTRRGRAAAQALARVAADARRASVGHEVRAEELVARFARAVPGARLPLAAPPAREPTARHALARLLAWLALLAVLLVVLLRAGAHPSLAHPSLADPAAMLAAGLRLAALVLTAYLFVTTAALAVAHVLRRRGAAHLLEAVAVPPVRRMAEAAIGATLTGGAVAAIATMADRAAPASQPAAVTTTTTETTVPAPTVPAPTVPARTPPAPALAPAQPSPVAPAEWTVRPGDHLWGIAEQVVAGRLGRPPRDAEVDPYWRRLVEANRARLADPANPDLVFPGDVFTLPPA